ncbi:MAG: wax ester/triacylglycerol synthase family O-acyltransferase [Dermatophilaceae bacterium]
MQQLSGLDEMFLSLDSSRTIGHIAGIGILKKTEGSAAHTVEFVRSRIAERLDTLPPLRWRLQSVPMRIDGRYWVEDEHLDLRNHIHAVTVPAPGHYEQVDDTMSEIMARTLDRGKPMWEFYLLDGLAGDRFAYVLKVSHGLADGSVVWTIFDHLADEPLLHPESSPPAHATRATKVGMFARGVAGAAARPVKVARLQVGLTNWAAGRVKEDKIAAIPATIAQLMPGELSKPFSALANRLEKDEGRADVASLMPTVNPPDSPFNGNVTNRMGMVAADLELATLRKVGKLAGGTINDAVVAVVAGACRRYMAEHAGIPDRPLVAAIPISWRTGDEEHRWANQVWMIFSPIPTHLDDPLERLKYAKEQLSVAKRNWQNMPAHLMREASTLVPAELTMGPGVKVMTRIPNKLQPNMFNLSISNVKGPTERPHYDGTLMERYVVFGFLSPGVGALFGGQSFGTHISVSATCCKDILPEYRQFDRYMHEALDELLALT